MKSNAVLLLKLLLLSTIFITIASAVKKGKNIKLNSMCSAASQLVNAYNSNCQSASPTAGGEHAKEAGVAVPACLAIQKDMRFASDLPESEQSTRMGVEGARNREDICNQPQDRIHALIQTLERALTHFGKMKALKNIYPVTAARTIQAQTALVLEHFRDAGKLEKIDQVILQEILNLEGQSKNVGILLEIANADTWIPEDRVATASIYWKLPALNSWKPWEILAAREIQPVSYFENLTHYDRHHRANSDCYQRMLRDCDLSQECASILLDPQSNMTTLDHHVIFFHGAIRVKMECVNEVGFANKFPKSDWKSVLEGVCSKMWNEANIIASATYPAGYKSLFLMHSSMCALIGYPNFLRSDWMDDLMTGMASTPNGCIPPNTPLGPADVELGFDVVDSDGVWCTVYDTYLGMQLLALHMRYYLETCPGAGENPVGN